MDLVDEIYRVAQDLPKEERFGLWSQTTRVAVSIPTNIAEGHGRGTATDYARFLDIAKGSCNELETLLEISRRRGYFSSEDCEDLTAELDEIGAMLHSLRTRLRSEVRSAVREELSIYDERSPELEREGQGQDCQFSS